ncbi:DUF3122 domain-containing protein [Microcoleus sp. N9_A1]|uniref:DUF3122 domain-containing protein n=1 Tax=Microcoleus sp. N9_A1 TaxID=3055380 RepID=UPI002FD3E5D3
MIQYRVKKMFSQFLLLGALVLTLSLGLGMLTTPHAVAAIRQLEEAPGQIVYQSRETLKDQHGSSWQAIAFQRVSPNGEMSLELRLVGFPGGVEIDRTQPLLLTDSLGQTLTASDTSSTIFTDLSAPEPHVSQYDILPLLPELQAEIPLKLTISTLGGEAIELSVSPSFVQEWKTLLSSRE